MQTRYAPLVKLRKNTMDKSERLVQQKNKELNDALSALDNSYKYLEEIEQPSSGNIQSLLVSRTLMSSQRALIENNKNWVKFAKEQLEEAKQQFKKDMIEYEKFKYLDLQELKKYKKELQIRESKELDEVARMTFGKEYR